MNIKLPSLWDDQQSVIDSIRQTAKKSKSMIVCSPCGSGKTRMASWIAISALNKGGTVVFDAPLKDLRRQISNTWSELGIEHSFVSSGMRFNPFSRAFVSTSATIAGRLDKAPRANVVIFDECFSSDTEILTERGFVRFDELADERVAQVTMGDRNLSFVKPIGKYSGPPKSTVMSVKTQNNYDMVVTAGHEMMIHSKYGGWKKKKVSDVVSCGYIDIPVAAYATGQDSILTGMEKFLIAFQADGNMHRKNQDGTSTVSFQFSKERKIKKFVELMESGGFRYRFLDKRSVGGNVKDKTRYMVYLDFTPTKDVGSYFDISKLSLAKCREIIEYMNIWDGHVVSETNYLYTNTDKKSADFYQSVACMAGYRTNMRHIVDDRKDTYNDVYRLFINKVDTVKSNGFKPVPVEYDGDVYCVSVPDGNIVTRRGGKVIVTGNCHLLGAQREKLIKHYKDQGATLIGLSASPERTDGKDLSDLYEDFIEGLSPGDLMDMGRLSGYVLHTPSRPDFSKLRLYNGDYMKSDVESYMESQSQIVGDMVEAYRKYADGKRHLSFATSIKHSMQIVEAFNSAGVTSVHIDGGMDDNERNKLIKAWARREIKNISSVNLFLAGFDAAQASGDPKAVVESISDGRPTKSRPVQTQKNGRATRIKPDGSDAIIIDHSSNAFHPDGSIHHGTPDMQITWQWRGKEKKGPGSGGERAVAVRQCPVCYFVSTPSEKCPSCGHEYETKSRMVEEVEGELFTVTRDELRGIKKEERKLQGRAQTIEELVELGKRKGYKNPYAWASKVIGGRKRG